MAKNKKKNGPRDMARGWIKDGMLMVQYSDYTSDWEDPIELREATDRDRELYTEIEPWARREYDGFTIAELPPNKKV